MACCTPQFIWLTNQGYSSANVVSLTTSSSSSGATSSSSSGVTSSSSLSASPSASPSPSSSPVYSSQCCYATGRWKLGDYYKTTQIIDKIFIVGGTP